MKLITREKTTIETRLGLYIGVTATVCVSILVSTILTTTTPFLAPLLSLPSVVALDSSNSMNLTWTAPGDNGNSGTAAAYDIRYSTSLIKEVNWDQAEQVDNEPTPAVAGSTETYQLTGLTPNTTYYVGIKTVDEAGNWSGISNVASKTTDCFEAWSCAEWEDCLDGQQARICTDLNSCGTEEEKPVETQSCTDPDELCEENWECTAWSACEDNEQVRTCADSNACGTEENKPGASRYCDVVGGPVGDPEVLNRETLIVTGVNSGGGPQVKTFDQDGNLRGQFWAFDQGFTGGINVYAEDLGRDNVAEIIVGAGPGMLPIIRIFDSHGGLLGSFQAYDDNFQGGVSVAAGDLDEDGIAEIVTIPQSGGGPNVRIFGYRDGQYVPVIESFFAYDVRFRGGVSLEVCDLDRDDKDEIITIPKSNGGPHLRIFGYRDGVYRPVILGLMTHHPNFRGGLNLGCGDLEGNGYEQIIAAPASLGGPHIRTFGRNRLGSISILSPGFMAFHPEFRGGVSLTTGDFDYNYQNEIVVSVSSGDRALIRIFYQDGTLMKEFLAYPEDFHFGVNVSAAKF
ncbi:MAG: fibronectin type III domain-containing protein [Patescibacteria group bacterium]